MKIINLSAIIIAFAMFFASCGGADSNKNNKNDSTKKQEVKKEDAKFEVLIFDKQKLSSEEISAQNTKTTGHLQFGKRWTDKNGMNIVFFMQREVKKAEKDEPERLTRDLIVYHLAKKEGEEYKLIRKVQDATKECSFENRAKFEETSVTVTDINKDGYGELTFAYKLGCSSELSPDTYKLIMLENGEKYAIRGNTIVQLGKDVYGGETIIDPSFDNAPEGFLNHAKEIWVKFQGKSVNVQEKVKLELAKHPNKNGKFSNHNLTYKSVYVLLDKIKQALANNNTDELSKYILFPLRINTAPGKSIKIKDANDFDKKYNSIFTKKLKEKIIAIDYKTLGDNSQGIFPKGGIIWLTEKNGKPKLFVVNAK